MATLHLMIGLPCSGKTTYARALAERERALLLTPDAWQIRLFGQDAGHPDHDERHSEIERIMWDVCERVLTLGANVILDFGCWAREERDDFRARAEALGANFKLHYMDVPEDELFRRVGERNKSGGPEAIRFDPNQLHEWIAIFEPPTEEETQ